jgi:DNA-directed RNA polymerase I subunit RPA1
MPPVAKSRRGGGGDSDNDEEDDKMNDDDNGKGNDKDDAFDDDDDDEVGTNNKRDRFMHTLEVQAQLKRTWQRDAFLMNCLFGAGPHEQELSCKPENGYQRFFMQAIPVPPNRFRPAMQLGGMAVEHGQTQYLSKMMQHNEQVRTHFAAAANAKDGNNANDANAGEPRAYAAWIELQTTVNCFMDASKDPSATPIQLLAPGIRQILERKEGLFRKNMMGKRVDYACRSVISPDPYIGTNEIGLPRYFATVLTYPTPVTDWNIREMRQLVERGPNNYPGARWVEVPITTSSSSSSSSAMSSLSPSIHQPTSRRVDLSKMNKHKRESVAAQLLTHLKSAGGKPCIVGRQLRDGDYVLMNRQVWHL